MRMILNKKIMDKNKYNRCSIRLKNYNYSSPGTYFITICTCNRQCLFGEIVKTEWQKTGILRPNIDVNTFIVMPNHLHGILIITDNDDLYHHRNRDRNRRDTLQRVSTESESELELGMGMESGMGMGTIEQFGKPTKNSIPAIIRLFKSTFTKQINQIRQTPGIPVWQRNYYEHIIRNDDELNKIPEYIINNPLTWKTDENYV